MKLLLFLALICISILSCTADGLYVDSINKCPSIPKHERATSIDKLRPDDIEVIAAMGDSVTAGLLEKNINSTYVSYDDFIEHRGSSFTAGGDSDAITFPNFLKHYSPNLYGASKGKRKARLCKETFFCFNSFHEPRVDFLNAAQSGATSLELPEQVNYLIERLGPGTPLANKWKVINVFIGYNDATAFCFDGRNDSFYETHTFTAIKKLSSAIDYAFINLVGLNSFSRLIERPFHADGYIKKFEHESINLRAYECNCCVQNGYFPDKLARSTRSIDLAIQRVSERLRAEGFKNNVVAVYQPMHVIDDSVPYNAVSNIDGFHPNTNAQGFLGKLLWDNMFKTQRQKYQSVSYSTEYPIYCPTGSDTFKIN